jgi:hypothetical protein
VALFNPHAFQNLGVQDIINNKETNMKKLIVSVVCVLIAPLAFAQPSSTNNKQGTTTTEPVRVTGTVIKMTSEEGATANYQPLKTLVVRQDSSNEPGRYVLDGRGHVLNKAGQVVQSAIKPGTRVRVYYANMGDFRVIDHVVIAD